MGNNFDKFIKDRQFIDEVLSKTESKLEFENKICRVLGYQDYGEVPDNLKHLVSKFYHFMLKKEISLIELTISHLREKGRLRK